MKRMTYISNRVIVFGLLCAVLFFISGAALLLCSLLQIGTVWLAVLLLLLAAGILLAGWFWIVVPYRKSELILLRFLEGHILSYEDVALVTLTPYTKKQMELIEQIIRSPKNMELNRRQAQYLALQNQINPHFLYNTLESIRGEALIAGLDSVADMTESLANFFRYTITKVENLVTVEEELNNCETYFHIQKYRFGDRLELKVLYDPDEWEEIQSCRLPKLTLQPILENSIIHGVEEKLGTAHLSISFRRTQDRLVIIVSDDGIGMDEAALSELNHRLGKDADSILESDSHRGGIALENVNNRIHLLFGDEFGLHIFSIAGHGTDVEISIPLKKH
ncbi:MAG: histidine kinase [Eubacteriales bacterium]|nr:histidine kinase [Eubacteriales bacterium]